MNSYVAAGYLITLVTLAAYAGWVMRRGRELSRVRRGTEGTTDR